MAEMRNRKAGKKRGSLSAETEGTEKKKTADSEASRENRKLKREKPLTFNDGHVGSSFHMLNVVKKRKIPTKREDRQRLERKKEKKKKKTALWSVCCAGKEVRKGGERGPGLVPNGVCYRRYAPSAGFTKGE